MNKKKPKEVKKLKKVKFAVGAKEIEQNDAKIKNEPKDAKFAKVKKKQNCKFSRNTYLQFNSAKWSRVENGQVVKPEGIIEASDVVVAGTSQRERRIRITSSRSGDFYVTGGPKSIKQTYPSHVLTLLFLPFLFIYFSISSFFAISSFFHFFTLPPLIPLPSSPSPHTPPLHLPLNRCRRQHEMMRSLRALTADTEKLVR